MNIEEWIKKQTKNITINGKIDIAPSRYDDYIDEDTLKEAMNDWENISDKERSNYSHFSDFFCESMYEKFGHDAVAYEIQHVMDTLSSRAADVSDEFYDEFDALCDEYSAEEIVEDIGGIEVNFDAAEFLNHDYHLNFILGTSEERNYSWGLIGRCFCQKEVREDDFKNCLCYLIRQQGHSVEDVILGYRRKVNGIERKQCMFVDSVIEELTQATSITGSTALTVCVSGSGKDLLDLLDAVYKKDKSLVFSRRTTVGLFDPFCGGGSLLEIALEKPFEIPAHMVYDIQVEGANTQCRGYTVDSVYGLIGYVWEIGNASLQEESRIAKRSQGITREEYCLCRQGLRAAL